MFAQNVVSGLMSFVVAAIMGKLGGVQLGAIGVSSYCVFVVSIALSGVSSVGLIFFAREHGSNDKRRFRGIFGLCMTVAIAVAIVCTAVAVTHPAGILRRIGGNPALIEYGKTYLFIVAFAFPASAVTSVLSYFLRSVEKTYYPMFVGIGVFAVDLFLNFLFVFGAFGFPPMGVKGAALAMLIVRILEAVALIVIFCKMKNPLHAPGARRDYFRFLVGPNRKELLISFFKIIWTIIVVDIFWIGALTVYKNSLTRMGVPQAAASGAWDSLATFMSALFLAAGNASAVLVGKSLGAGKPEQATLYAKKFMRLNFFYCIPIGLFFIIWSRWAPGLFHLDKEAAKYFKESLIVTGILFSMRGFNMGVIIGVIRAGGDMIFNLFTQFISLLGVLVVYLLSRRVGAPFVWVFAATWLEDAIRTVVISLRFKSGRWAKKI